MDENCQCGAPLQIGAAAAHLGTSVEALRYYETQRLVSPARDDAGRRVFDQRDMDALHVVISLRAVGFSIQDIARLIAQKTDAPPAELVRRAREVLARFRADLDERRAAMDRAEHLLDDWGAELDSTGW